MIHDEKGSAATLAIFTVFVILCSVLALHTFEAGYQRQLSAVQQRMATDTTRAVAAAVETELNYTLRTAIEAAMYDAGREGGTKERVVDLFLQYFDDYQQIEPRWSYSNFEEIYVPYIENDMFENMYAWLPDGSLRATGYLDATFTHLMGVKAYGIKLDAGVVPRYGRMFHLAHLVWDNEDVKNMPESELENFEEKLDNDYACEYLEFELEFKGLGLKPKVTVHDLYAGRAIAAENED